MIVFAKAFENDAKLLYSILPGRESYVKTKESSDSLFLENKKKQRKKSWQIARFKRKKDRR
jgi:hypothetical protein